MKLDLEIPEGSLAVPLIVVVYVDRDARLQASAIVQDTPVPLVDSVSIAEEVLTQTRKKADIYPEGGF